MDVLVVGGTGFLGGAIRREAVARGHRVVVLTRGVIVQDEQPGVEYIKADRRTNPDVLKGRSFDIVADTCAYAPDDVEKIVDALGGRIGCYAVVSSVSVYPSLDSPGTDEMAAAAEATEADLEHVADIPLDKRSSAFSYEAYGPLKRSTEMLLQKKMPGKALIIRAGLLVGVGDDMDRLGYWVRRIDQGGTVIGPGDASYPMQLIDVRDAAAFLLDRAALADGHIYNVTSQRFTIGELFEACIRVSASNAVIKWIREDKLLAIGLKPWTDIPLWTPRSDEIFRSILDISVERAYAAGLKPRPLDDTLRDVLQWDRGRRAVVLKAGIPAEKETELLTLIRQDA